MILETIVALIAGANLWIYCRQHKAEKRLNDIDERIKRYEIAEYERAEEARQKASVTVSLKKHGVKQVIIRNSKGSAEARNVDLHCGKPLLLGGESRKLPIATLPPEGEVQLLAGVEMEDLPLKVKVTWEDQSGPHSETHTLYMEYS